MRGCERREDWGLRKKIIIEEQTDGEMREKE